MTDENRERVRKLANDVSKVASDKGLLIEAGWVSFRYLVIDGDPGEATLRHMRQIFFAGAMHLFQSMMVIMDADGEPTENDLKRMSMIDAELAEFSKEIEAEMQRRRQ